MITKETARKIWLCYQEIEAGENLLVELEKPMENTVSLLPGDFEIKEQCCRLGVPTTGDRSRATYKIKPGLALSITRAHIAEKKKELAEANAIARVELYTSIKPGKISIKMPSSDDAKGSVLGEFQIKPDDVIGPGEISISKPVDTRPTGS